MSVDHNAAAEMVRRSGQRGVPVITVDNDVIVGFDRPRLERLLAAGAMKKVVFGAALADAASYFAKRGQVPVFGALVGKISPGTPAARIGLQPGDIITQFGLRVVANAEAVEKAVEPLSPGARVSVTYSRGNQQMTRDAIF